MSQYMEISDERIESLLAFLTRYGRQPLVVDSDADFPVVSALQERRTEFPTVYIEMRPRRRYFEVKQQLMYSATSEKSLLMN